MKKISLFCLSLLFAALTLTGAAHAKTREITVTLPDYRVEVNECDVYYWDSVYPFLSYKDVTYFPMTYDYCRTLGLTTSWVDGDGFYVAYTAGYGQVPVYETTVNAKENTAVLPSYKIYVNGKEYDNSGAEYPLFNFRGVTYFPMTWDFAHEEFCWGTEWTNDRFTITRNGAWNMDHQIQFVRREDEGILFRHDYVFPIVQANGGESLTSVTAYQKLSYATGLLSEEDKDYVYEKKKNDFNTTLRTSKEIECRIENGKVCLEGKEVEEVVVPTEEELKERCPREDDLTFGVYAGSVTLDDVDFFHVTTYLKHRLGPSSDTQYTYAQAGDKLVFLGTDVEPFATAKIGDTQYFSVRPFRKGVMRNYSDTEILYRVDPDGTLTNVNDLYDDYGNIQLLGSAGGKLYLKCTWSPQSDGTIESEYLISAPNDGYFTYNGETLEKIARYRPANRCFVSPDGHLYAIVNWKPEIIRIV